MKGIFLLFFSYRARPDGIVDGQFFMNVLIWAFIVHYSGFMAYKCEGIVALFVTY